MTLDLTAPALPLAWAEGGRVVRVRGTRIPLETIVWDFQHGATPEEIVLDFPTLDLGDVYTVIGYYLHHRDAVDAYVREGEIAAERVRQEIEARFSPIGIRERLLARRAQMIADATSGR